MNKSELIKAAFNARLIRGIASLGGKTDTATIGNLRTALDAVKTLPKNHAQRGLAAKSLRELRRRGGEIPPVTPNTAAQAAQGPKAIDYNAGLSTPPNPIPVDATTTGPGMRNVTPKGTNNATTQVANNYPVAYGGAVDEVADQGFADRLARLFDRPGVGTAAVGLGTGTGGYLLGSGLGESRGRESGQVMGTYEGYMRAMQEAQQRYNNQGIIDRILGNNPF
jgi:hypothetical protein